VLLTSYHVSFHTAHWSAAVNWHKPTKVELLLQEFRNNQPGFISWHQW
jgi:hypothetical protein